MPFAPARAGTGRSGTPLKIATNGVSRKERMNAWKRGLVALALVSLGLLAGCQTVQTTAPGAIGIERKQQMLVSEEQVEQGAMQAYAGELQKARQEGKLNTNPQVVQRVRSISERLI